MEFKVKYLPIIILLLLILFCKKMEQVSEEPATPASVQRELAMDSLADAKAGLNQLAPKYKKSVKKDSLSVLGAYKFDLAVNRLLEYKVTLLIEVDKPDIARKRLYKIAEKNGYIESAHSRHYEDDNIQVNFVLIVKSEKLYQVLIEIEKLGLVKKEVIKLIDHTADFQKNIFKDRVYAGRLRRRERNLTTGSKKFLYDNEQALEKTENELIEVKFSKWQIRDKVKWATINIDITTKGEYSIYIPEYKKSFYQFIEVLLYIPVILIFIIPFVLIFYILGLLIGKWKKRKI